jgi:hypothetical protein
MKPELSSVKSQVSGKSAGKTIWPADHVERWPIERLIPFARNARTHSDTQVSQIASSIREWGWTNPVLVAAVALRTASNGADETLWTTLFNGRVSDWVGDGAFIRFDEAHHRLALHPSNRPGLLAIEYAVEGLNQIMQAMLPSPPRGWTPAHTGTFYPVASHRDDRSRFCCRIEHGKSGRLCDLGLHRRLRSLDPYRRPKLKCTRFMGSRRSYPHRDRAPERFRPHLKSTPFGGASAA